MSYEIYYKQNDIEVRRAFPTDADMMANRLRQYDIDEIWASHNLTPWEALYESIMVSTVALTITHKGLCLGLFGISAETVLGDRAMIYFLGTNELDRIQFRFARHSRHFVKMFLNMYPYLYNYTDARNIKSLSWLRMCGAKIKDAQPYGIMRKPFHYFYFER